MGRVKDMQINEQEVLINNFNSSIKKKKKKEKRSGILYRKERGWIRSLRLKYFLNDSEEERSTTK